MDRAALIDMLKAKGKRITRARVLLCATLDTTTAPLSAMELQAELSRRKCTVNKTTIYRELECLVGLGLVREVSLGDQLRRFERKQHTHHHHVICIKCKTVEDITLPEAKAICAPKRMLRNFKVLNHLLEFQGLCGRCQMS